MWVRVGCGEEWKFTAARRMKGVVRPQARPTRRKPRVQLKIEGEGGGVEVSGEAIVLCERVALNIFGWSVNRGRVHMD